MNRDAPVIPDETELLRSLAPLEGARLLELGCGKADFARRLLERTPVASIAALKVDKRQHEKNVASAPSKGLEFHYGGAQEIPFPDASFDGVLMMKSLHHVPGEFLDRALAEVRRVLKPGGWLYCSEPVFAGEYNDILKLFHDERAVRQAAREALDRAGSAGVLEPVEQREFLLPRDFRDYDDFVEKVVKVTHTDHAYSEAVAAEVRSRFEKYQKPGGARFMAPMRVDFMRRPSAEG